MNFIISWFFRLAVLYMAAGFALGIFMGASNNHSMAPVHAHLNLLGWVTMALFAFFYRAWPAAADTRLARWHFWVYVPAHFVMMVALAAFYRGVAAAGPVLGLSSMVVGVGVLFFIVVAWRATAQPAAARHQAAVA